MKGKTKRIFDVLLTYCLLLIAAGVFFFPCLWLVLSSLSTTGNLYSIPGFFPEAYSLSSFENLFFDTAMYNYPKWLLNTFIIAVSSSFVSTILVIMTAYVISRFEFKMRRPLMKGALILGMFPSFMSMTILYILMTQFGLVNNLFGLILIYSCTAPTGYLVQKGFFDTIPTSIYEAARIDGANNVRIFRTITLPLAKPMIVYTALTSFTWPWSDYVLPSMLLKNKDNWTVAVGLMKLGETEFARFASGAVFIAVPIVILYFLLAKNMVTGLTAGAVKG